MESARKRDEEGDLRRRDTAISGFSSGCTRPGDTHPWSPVIENVARHRFLQRTKASR
jgi:hypothetical protein